MGFSVEQIKQLSKCLELDRIKQREQDGRKVSYLEGYDVINKANEIFGYDGWDYEPVGQVFTEKVGDKYLSKATVKVTVHVEGGRSISRTDVGYCVPAVGSGKSPRPDAFDTSEKGAVTDALKRALRSFGTQFGNSLYDKDNPIGYVTKPCPMCNNLMYWKEGISTKTKIPNQRYEGWVCSKYKELGCKSEITYLDGGQDG